MTHMTWRACSFVAALLCAGASHAEASDPPKTVSRLDVPRYMGTWYEISKYPNRFQKACVAHTRAEYRLMPDQKLEVANSCREADGEVRRAVGQARQVGGPESPKLQVRFAPAWLSFLPAVWGDYWVIDIDSNYQLVAVSEPKREFLWVLSRTPQVAAAHYEALLRRLAEQGFELSRLQKTPQESAR
jgi:apolipoprotein D and lipocalin family protein